MNLRALLARPRPPWLAPLLALAVVWAIFAALAPDTFLPAANTVSMLDKTVVVATCALGMTFVIASGGIDLSTGSLVALSTVLVAKLLQRGMNPWTASLLSIVALGAVGAIVGLLVGRFRMLPFIVTLGTMSILRGVATGLADEQKIDVDAHGLDRLMMGGALSPGLAVTVLLTALSAIALSWTRFGRHVLAVGSNERAARLVGIDPAYVKIVVYTLASALAAIGGVMEFAKLTVGDPTDAVGLELKVIAAVVVGGAPLAGGEGSIVGAVIGALLMTVIETGGVHLGMRGWVQQIVTGVIIVVAVALDRARHPRQA